MRKPIYPTPIPSDRALDAIYITQSRRGAKKVLARPVIVQSYFGDDADVTVIPAVIRNNSSPARGGGPCEAWGRGTRRVSPSRGHARPQTPRHYTLTQRRRERRVSKLRAPLPLREFVMVRCGMLPAFHRRCWGHLRPAHCKLIRRLGRVSGLGEVGEGFRPVDRAQREVCAIN